MLDLAVPPLTVTALALGERAHAALSACDGRLDVIHGFEDAPYRLAGEQLVWIGTRPRVHHPRAVLLASLPREKAQRLRLEQPLPAPSRRAQLRAGDATAEKLALAAAALLDRLDAFGGARGLGAVLRGKSPGFPLGAVEDKAADFALACGRGEWTQALRLGRSLLGVGPGLTPSGDDFVGGALFALRLGARGSRAVEVDDLCRSLCSVASERTHLISATLLADLAALRGYSVIDELGLAAMDGSPPRLIAAARALVALGHSSGWDLLAGFIAGAGGKFAAAAARGKRQ